MRLLAVVDPERRGQRHWPRLSALLLGGGRRHSSLPRGRQRLQWADGTTAEVEAAILPSGRVCACQMLLLKCPGSYSY